MGCYVFRSSGCFFYDSLIDKRFITVYDNNSVDCNGDDSDDDLSLWK